MLRSLHIKNIVLIENLILEFSEGLSALTGETGAGKSILLDSLGLALGARSDAGLVRRGAEQASVTASFDLQHGHPIFHILNDQGIDAGDGDLILRRTLSVDGRSKAFINDQAVSVAFMKSVGEMLVDIHGQFETYGLLDPVTHRSVLDLYAKNSDLISMVSGLYLSWRDAQDELEAAQEAARRAAEDEDYIRACVDELRDASPEEGEEVVLVEKKKLLQNLEALRGCYLAVSEALGGEQGADMMIGQAWRLLDRQADKLDEDSRAEMDNAVQSLGFASEHVQNACGFVDRLAMRLDVGDYNENDIEDRLYLLRSLARKHHCTADELVNVLNGLAAKLEIVDNQGEALARLEKKVETCKQEYRLKAEELHDRRKTFAQRLDKIVNLELKPLKLGKSVFETSVELCHGESAWGANGFDTVRFLVATNASSDTAPVLEPLNKIASGGEMARFMLALKVVLAESAPVTGVYVFDEIDTGIGGATASAVGERLSKLAKAHQVMVVTHSPQVASVADHHWMVSKDGGNTTITPLKGSSRKEEVARMLAGAEITAEARAAAAKLLDTG